MPWAWRGGIGSAGARPMRSYLAHQQQASDVAGGFGAFSKVLRMLLQSGVLGVGAYLVIDGQATGGIMIASSILTSRALAPVELAIANWKGFVGARQGWARLQHVSRGRQLARCDPLKLPAPQAVAVGRERRMPARPGASASPSRTSPSS